MSKLGLQPIIKVMRAGDLGKCFIERNQKLMIAHPSRTSTRGALPGQLFLLLAAAGTATGGR